MINEVEDEQFSDVQVGYQRGSIGMDEGGHLSTIKQSHNDPNHQTIVHNDSGVIQQRHHPYGVPKNFSIEEGDAIYEESSREQFNQQKLGYMEGDSQLSDQEDDDEESINKRTIST
jgi:hypothetical protein